ncbi:MAG: hypothetical protein QM529_05590 [Hydrotalea sp.]|nr:hypothetical protein [Hydrotalea sp.]
MKNIFLSLLCGAMLLGLTACGLRPAYELDKTTGNFKNTILQDISIDSIASREGQILINELDYAFGAKKKSTPPNKGLRATIALNGTNIGDTAIANVNQIEEVVVAVHFVLYEKSSGKVLDEFDISTNSTNVVASLSGFTQSEVRKKKLEFAMKNIALDARNRLLLYQPGK